MTSNDGPDLLQVAIVGSGPSGFYAAEIFLRRHPNLHVDMFERLPTPFGLVRGGVAPDHPKIKQVSRVYDKIARSPRFSYFGNVAIGDAVSIQQLRNSYHAVILACGASANKRLGISGEDLACSHTATEFVGWYNGHPDYRNKVFDLSGERAVVIGQGNVAADVARILATPVEDLRLTDIAEHALDALAQSRVREVYIIGRRGPAQMKFTAVELRELGQIHHCAAMVSAGDLELGATCAAELSDPRGDQLKKNVAHLRAFTAPVTLERSRRIWFRFLESPLRINGSDRVQSVTLGKNRLQGPPFGQCSVATAQTSELPCDLIFSSVGCTAVPISGVGFDEQRGIIPNLKGRCLHYNDPTPGLYVTGWLKRGPTGAIGTNRADSIETVESVLEDLARSRVSAKPGAAGLRDVLTARQLRIVSYADWDKIDLAERYRGQERGKPREKFTRVPEMMTVLDRGPT
jgi:ferredoxin/flavodoxin---NADP+ reductase